MTWSKRLLSRRCFYISTLFWEGRGWGQIELWLPQPNTSYILQRRKGVPIFYVLHFYRRMGKFGQRELFQYEILTLYLSTLWLLKYFIIYLCTSTKLLSTWKTTCQFQEIHKPLHNFALDTSTSLCSTIPFACPCFLSPVDHEDNPF